MRWGILHVNLENFFSTDEKENLLKQLVTLPNDKTNTLHHYSADVSKTSFPWVSILHRLSPFINLLWGFKEEDLYLHGGFVINYNINGNKNLVCHTDDSDITINFCMRSLEVEGNDILFHGKKSTKVYKPDNWGGEHSVQPKSEWALIHEGSHQHETMPIKSGQRLNVVLWFKRRKIIN